MRNKSHILALNIAVLLLCGLGVYRFSQKAKFPADVEAAGPTVFLSSISPESTSGLLPGDTIAELGTEKVSSDEYIEFYCDHFPVGASIKTVISRNGNRLVIPVGLIREFQFHSVFIYCFAAGVFFLVGLFVALRKNTEKAAIAFNDLCLSISALILLTSGYYHITPNWLGYALEIPFYASYAFTPVFFLRFMTVFPCEIKSRRLFPILFGVAAVLTVWSSAAFLFSALQSGESSVFTWYRVSFKTIKIFFALLFFAGLGVNFYTFRQSTEDSERRKLLWIFFGITFGVTEYIFLQLVPQIITGKTLVREDIVIGLSVFAPVSFAIAVVRYKLFDIDLFLKRSTLYAGTIALLVACYLGIVWIFMRIVSATDLPPVLANMGGAVLIALLFEPLRKRMRTFIDRKFFHISYNFLKAQREILENIKFVTTKISLANLLTEQIDALIPVSKIGFFLIESSDRLRLIAHHHFEILERRQVPLERAALKTSLELPLALKENIEEEIPFEVADPVTFRRWGIALAIPMLSSSREILGFLILGEKKSGRRFTIEDMSLLLSVSTQAGVALERLNIEYQLLIEQAESERLEELNRLKSFFVSSVSHDLKTPLTSIRLFAEFLKDHENLPRQKALEYYSIIEGEANRLSRLITNVLDFAKIEKGTKEYLFDRCDLNEIAMRVMESMRYQFSSNGFLADTSYHTSELAIMADSGAVLDAVTNLLTNAMKYSPPERKSIRLSTSREQGFAILSVEDQGYGIAESETTRIFESFYRIGDARTKSAGGAGLGLSLVKHTMDAHGGKVKVDSVAGKGSIFALYFPLSPVSP